MLQYSMERICAAIGDNRTFRSPLYCKLGAKYSAHHPITLCGLWSRTYTKYLQLLIVRPQYSTEPDCAATTDMPTFGCAIYCNLGAEYSAPPPVYTMCTVVPDIYKVFTAPHSQATIFNWTWLRSYYRYADIWMRDILQPGCWIWRTTASLHNVYCGPGHIESIYSSPYSGRNIQLNVSALLMEIWRQ
jgi:hypothetical protein